MVVSAIKRFLMIVFHIKRSQSAQLLFKYMHSVFSYEIYHLT